MRTMCKLLFKREHVSTHAWIGHIGALVHAAHVTVRRKRRLRYRRTTHSCYGASAADGGIVPPAGLKEGAVAAAPADVISVRADRNVSVCVPGQRRHARSVPAPAHSGCA